MDRRGFLLSSAFAGAGLASASRLTAMPTPAEAAKAELKISIQEGFCPGGSLEEKLDKAEKWGIVGFEPHGGGLGGRVEAYKKALQGRKIKISAICAGAAEPLTSQDPEERKRCVQSTKDLLTHAGALGSTGLIIVPARNGHKQQMFGPDARKALIDGLKEIGEHAVQCNTRVLLEPLCIGEAYFLRQVEDGAAICRDVNSPGVCVMGDFYHMGKEETDLMAAFLAGGKWLHHVHLATCPARIMPGQEKYDFSRGFMGLKMIGYNDFMSFECGCRGDKEVEIPKSIQFLKSQWDLAQV